MMTFILRSSYFDVKRNRAAPPARQTGAFTHTEEGVSNMATHEVVLCAPVRTAIGAFNGSLKTTPAVELGAAVVRAAVARAGLDPAKVDSVLLGNVVQAG